MHEETTATPPPSEETEKEKTQSWTSDENALEKPHIRELRPEEQSTKLAAFQGKFFTSFYYSFLDADGEQRTGIFVAKRLTLGEIGAVGVENAAVNGGQDVDRFTDWLHYVFAKLRAQLVKVPEWWAPPEALYDVAIVKGVFDYVQEWEKRFNRQPVGKRRRAAENSRSSTA